MRLGLMAGLLLTASSAMAHPAVGIVVDRSGTVFYSDTVQVWAIRPDGTRVVAVPDVHTHELWLDRDGALHGEHLWYEGDATKQWGHRVWRRTSDGRVQDVIPSRRGFLTDHRDFGFQRDSAGAFYWMQGSRPAMLRMRAPSGEVRTLASFDFTNQSWLSVAPDGTAYVSENGAVWRVRRGAAPERLPAALSVSRERMAVMGAAQTSDGGLVVAAYDDRAVRRLSPSGAVTTVTTTPAGWGPTGVAVGADGAIWILEASESNAQRVRRVAADGSVRVF